MSSPKRTPSAASTSKPAAKKPAAKASAPAAPKKSSAKPAPKAAPAAKKTATKKAATKKAPAKTAAAKKGVAAAVARIAPKKAAQGTARNTDRDRYKVSPLRGMELDKWFASQVSGWQADFVRRLLDLIARAVPGATVEIKWRQPVVAANGKDFLYVRVAKSHVTVGLWQGIVVDDPKKILDARRTLQVKGPSELDEAAFVAIVKQAARARS